MNIDITMIEEITLAGITIIDAIMIDKDTIVIVRADTTINNATIKIQGVSKRDSSRINFILRFGY